MFPNWAVCVCVRMFVFFSLLNIHPSLHDAFGMTVLEAASVATPSLIHDSKGTCSGYRL